jgi:membrane-bound inhibitor of C-type lysozyme
MKNYTLKWVKSGSGEKFTGKDVQFWTKMTENGYTAMLEFKGKKYNCKV